MDGPRASSHHRLRPSPRTSPGGAATIARRHRPLDARAADNATRELAAAKALTFEQAAHQYFDSHERKWKNAKHRSQFLSSLRDYAFPKIGRLSVSSIDTGLVLKCVEPIWQKKTETASRVRGRIEKILDWSTVRGYRTGDNPARWKGHIGEVLPAPSSINKAEHHPALPFTEIPEFMTRAGHARGHRGSCARNNGSDRRPHRRDYRCAMGGVDLQGKVWTVPANRIKGGKEHRVPLSDRAVEILNTLPTERGNHHVFIGPSKGTGLSNMAMAAVLKRMGRGNITVHGFRSSFRDWAAERTTTRITWSRWRWPTLSARRSRPLIGAVIYSTNVASLWPTGRATAGLSGAMRSTSCPCAGKSHDDT